MPEDKAQPERPRGFWSGTITFGLVSVPVSLFVATRPSGASLRMVDDTGTPLSRVYFCSREEKPLDRDEIVRGYEVEKDRFVVVEDEELTAIAPEKSEEINLERFVDLDDIDPVYFQRAYFLAPGRGGARPYRLLARAMEDAGRAGVASFVMRGKEYLVAIIAERGILRAETLRFHDELRTPETVGLPALTEVDQAQVRSVQKAIRKLHAEELDRDALADRQARRLEEVVAAKLRAGQDVVQASDDTEPSERESAEIIDLMQVLKQSVEDTTPARRSRSGRGKGSAKAPRPAARHDNLAQLPKSELYARAQELEIPGRSNMSKDQLIEAIRDAS